MFQDVSDICCHPHHFPLTPTFHPPLLSSLIVCMPRMRHDEEVCSAHLWHFYGNVGHFVLHLLAPALRVAVPQVGQRVDRGAANGEL